MISPIAEEVPQEMQSSCEWCVLLQSQSTYRGRNDRLADRSKQKLLMIIYQRIA